MIIVNIVTGINILMLLLLCIGFYHIYKKYLINEKINLKDISVENHIYLAGTKESLERFYNNDKDVYEHAELNDLATMLNMDILNNIKSGRYDNQLQFLSNCERNRMSIITEIEFEEKNKKSGDS